MHLALAQSGPCAIGCQAARWQLLGMQSASSSRRRSASSVPAGPEHPCRASTSSKARSCGEGPCRTACPGLGLPGPYRPAISSHCGCPVQKVDCRGCTRPDPQWAPPPPPRPRAEPCLLAAVCSEYNIVETQDNVVSINGIVTQVGALGARCHCRLPLPRGAGGTGSPWVALAGGSPCPPSEHLPQWSPPTVTVLQAWSSLRAEEQAPFETHARQDRQRYESEQRVFEDMQARQCLLPVGPGTLSYIDLCIPEAVSCCLCSSLGWPSHHHTAAHKPAACYACSAHSLCSCRMRHCHHSAAA